MRTNHTVRTLLSCSLALLAGACAVAPDARGAQIHTARLDGAPGADFAALRGAFVANNPGYDLAWHPGVRRLDADRDADRVAFVQGPAARIDREQGPSVGDVVLVRRGEHFELPRDAAHVPVDLLVFSLPEPLPADLPPVVRPDWDPKITDTPGGCATEGDAYRRILLTWKPEVGPYVMRQLNAHRVRITNSFSHYHPADVGFEEFYLVQQAPADARLLTSTRVDRIEARDVTRGEAKDLLQERPLAAGDLVYLPRGTMHRGLGGALVQVISVPGFVPKTEVGVDHHLWAINKKLGLQGDDALPFHVVAARTAVVK